MDKAEQALATAQMNDFIMAGVPQFVMDKIQALEDQNAVLKLAIAKLDEWIVVKPDRAKKLFDLIKSLK